MKLMELQIKMSNLYQSFREDFIEVLISDAPLYSFASFEITERLAEMPMFLGNPP